MSRVRMLALVFALTGGLLGLYVASAHAQGAVQPPAGPFQSFAVKFLCGQICANQLPSTEEGPVKPGNYQTAINIHNPNPATTVTFFKKAVLLFRADQRPTQPEQQMPPGEFRMVELRPDFGMEIDCADIRNVLLGAAAPPPPTFIKGWVVLQQPVARKAAPLDVTAVFTAHTWQSASGACSGPEGFSLDVVTIEPKAIGF